MKIIMNSFIATWACFIILLIGYAGLFATTIVEAWKFTKAVISTAYYSVLEKENK